ncbi:MAG: hypothetical protein F4201_08915 [Nitrospira sp. SB0677_bin_15]|nr:hypothetical protein [Nitrospira sp. SB0667_bin_9]MYD30632.1 hypothetical protein [Nitrospira sp. SB0661_bin_20]MYG40914.1 hypothetical protein [Nitrospira sp. SB0677_bin_15]MYH03050.1 hypothetical protein [Nitrospira sp. SB0675_bin_23]MYJ22341.1 hypothetical protein [Nitrospira sp. SB0673_bin_12]
MNFQLSLLVQLQQLDLKLHDLEQQQQQIPERFHAAQTPVDEARKRAESLKTMLETIAAERRSGEDDLSAHESHVQKMRGRLNELKTNKEYQAHLFELELANKKKDGLEERVLLAMERGEEKRKELDEVEKRLQELIQTLEREKSELEALSAKLADEVAQIEQEKQDLIASLEKQVHHRYSMLKSSMKLVVVATVRGETCQGCQLQIPPQLVASVKRADDLLTCPYCHCILYYEAALHETPEDVGAEEPVAQEQVEG